jgi:hypothetical protein
MNIENIFIDRSYKAGAVYSPAAGATQPMPRPLPSPVFRTKSLFDFIII